MDSHDLTRGEGPPAGRLHCCTCDRGIPCTPEELHGYIEDDPTWPRCSATKMAVVLGGPARRSMTQV